jgi:ATP-binding cassette subfamily B protein
MNSISQAKKTGALFSGFHQISRVGMYMFSHVSNYRIGKDLRLYNLAPAFADDISRFNNTFVTLMSKFWKLVVRFDYSRIMLSTAFNALVYGYVAIKALFGAFPIGNVVQYIGALTRFGQAFQGLGSNLGWLWSNNEFLAKYFDFIDMPNKLYHGTIPVEKRRDNEYKIEFVNVSFKYPGSETMVLKNFNLKLRIGQKLAVVGMNGSGKTTMIKLLCRLYDPTEGVITLNGVDIKMYDYAEYMSIFSVVFQDFKLFSFPLGQNVAASVCIDATKAAECLDMVGMTSRINSMSKIMDTCLYKDFDEDGVEISGGEAQKIALARALYKNAPFIILDEPTAALDPIAEFEIYSRFNEIVGEKTAIYISHRLSSCRFCDDIAVFHEGELIQRGSHDELVADDCGKYYELWNAQAQYYVNA